MIFSNKRANIYAAVMVAIVVFMIGMITVNFLKPEITSARNSITCTAPATDGSKMLCLVLDTAVPYFIVLVLSIAMGVITDKVLI